MSKIQKYFHPVPAMPWKDERFIGPFRCLNCEYPLAYMLEKDGKTVLVFSRGSQRNLVYRAEIVCPRCSRKREFVSSSV